jgi:DNA-binding response OmpR family regulator
MKLLIVEDDPDISAFMREGLDEAGYYTTVCRDGKRALHLAQTGSFSLILLDVMLPTMSGTEICKALRSAGNNTPILMVTAKDAVPERVSGLELGADDYLVKPFDFAELLARVRALLRRDNSRKQSLIQVDDLVVDTAGRTVTRGGVPISLTNREYTLLEALAGHTGQVLSREAITSRVWLDDQSVSNVVDVYIKNLRKKIDEGAANKLIHTVHGLGYVLRSEDQPKGDSP